MVNNYILRAELTDSMNRLRDCRKRCRSLEVQVAKMEAEITELRNEIYGQQTDQADSQRTPNN